MLIHCSSVTSVIKYLSAKGVCDKILISSQSAIKYLRAVMSLSAQLSAQSEKSPIKAGCWMMEQMHKDQMMGKQKCPIQVHPEALATALRLQLVTSGWSVCKQQFTPMRNANLNFIFQNHKN